MAHDEHQEIVPNPDYDGPGQHCLPPQVKDTVVAAVVFAVLMALLAWGGAVLGGVI